jgi:hypothetical protein
VKGQGPTRWARQMYCIWTISHLVLAILNHLVLSSNGVISWGGTQGQIVMVRSPSNGVIDDTRYSIVAPGVFEEVSTVSEVGKPLKTDRRVRAKQLNEWMLKSSAIVFAGDKGSEFTVHIVHSETKPQDEQAVSPAYKHLKDLNDYLGGWVA